MIPTKEILSSVGKIECRGDRWNYQCDSVPHARHSCKWCEVQRDRTVCLLKDILMDRSRLRRDTDERLCIRYQDGRQTESKKLTSNRKQGVMATGEWQLAEGSNLYWDFELRFENTE